MSFISKAVLKDIEEKDLKRILEWRNQEWIRRVMYHSEEISMEQHLSWFKNLQSSETAVTKLFYYDGIPYGVLNVNNIHSQHSRCEWGFYIGEQNTPKGMGTILGFTALHYIFNELNIRKLCAEVIGSNQKSRAFHEKMGFSGEGILRKHIIKDEKEEDVFLYGMFQYEWNEWSLRILRLIEGRYI
ncbi:UDP-4-amino-4,6-dideoxy-N-acetyl-beta-L-altrosamine N-acetyltransferase [Domibacillus antri]|uniref:UDP-4-amino-4, 6-dideoxy-N-acetyl-beta-L-altrosamine N-acetyltransferase n=1 Tax=Domibacillus antri TaxID=1714264 RepID=A0A1Q8Q9L0_9BACI|nr:UDP-4-amino-4,6-dideoxy-N-acetyl-beta-L-altrosamine N-acetyltransferase [Domibacillus antri]OLN24028.1 UDP-4-amino-4,6-dideoxy-N-acetyl-beta-L-altrosamine N-acetyltransferase [Domibacillus antri]